MYLIKLIPSSKNNSTNC